MELLLFTPRTCVTILVPLRDREGAGGGYCSPREPASPCLYSYVTAKEPAAATAHPANLRHQFLLALYVTAKEPAVATAHPANLRHHSCFYSYVTAKEPAVATAHPANLRHQFSLALLRDRVGAGGGYCSPREPASPSFHDRVSR